MLKYLVEFVGTFFFLSVILNYANAGVYNAFPIGIALIAAILFGGSISGGHFNPAVSVMMVANKSMPLLEAMFYIFAQVLGGLAAVVFRGLK